MTTTDQESRGSDCANVWFQTIMYYLANGVTRCKSVSWWTAWGRAIYIG
jgi:hypothetical protein